MTRRGRACRKAERGSAVTEFTVLGPAFLTLFVIAVAQLVIFEWGGYVANEAAQRAVDAARVEQGTVQAGQGEANAVFNGQGTDILSEPKLQLAFGVDAQGQPVVRAVVDAAVVSLLPIPLRVHADYQAPVEQFSVGGP